MQLFALWLIFDVWLMVEAWVSNYHSYLQPQMSASSFTACL